MHETIACPVCQQTIRAHYEVFDHVHPTHGQGLPYTGGECSGLVSKRLNT
jgi:hypothetical protein